MAAVEANKSRHVSHRHKKAAASIRSAHCPRNTRAIRAAPSRMSSATMPPPSPDTHAATARPAREARHVHPTRKATQPTYSSAARASAYTTYTHAARRRPTGEPSATALATNSSVEPSYMGADVHEKGKPVTRAGIYKPTRRAEGQGVASSPSRRKTHRRRGGKCHGTRRAGRKAPRSHEVLAMPLHATGRGARAPQQSRSSTQPTAVPPVMAARSARGGRNRRSGRAAKVQRHGWQ